jgi:hypothetical protein
MMGGQAVVEVEYSEVRNSVGKRRRRNRKRIKKVPGLTPAPGFHDV